MMLQVVKGSQQFSVEAPTGNTLCLGAHLS